MPRRLFDSSILIAHLRVFKLGADSTCDDARACADKLIENKGFNAIVSPVEIEVLAGVRDQHELELMEAFLSLFKVIDGQHIPPDGWTEARRIAKRCLSRATWM